MSHCPGFSSERRLGLFAAFFILTAGCMGSPSPLAPGLRGSVGVPHNGVLTDAAELPKSGPGFERLRPRSKHYWGVPRLVEAIAQAASAVQEKASKGPPLVVGDLSGQYGGKIPNHNSHRTGRDVDLLWYVTTPSGAPLKNPGFVQILGDGLAHVPGWDSFVRLDVPREWLLLKELLQNPKIGVQFLFVSRDVEALIIDYARSRETDLNLVWQAQMVMLQPGDSAPHADHVHVRIACLPEEYVTGCEGGGPYWTWLPDPLRLNSPVVELVSEIANDDPFSLGQYASSPGPVGADGA